VSAIAEYRLFEAAFWNVPPSSLVEFLNVSEDPEALVFRVDLYNKSGMLQVITVQHCI
jgi:hypothetical protein